MEATGMSICRDVDKDTVAQPYNGIGFSPEKEGNSDPCCNTDGPCGYHAK